MRLAVALLLAVLSACASVPQSTPQSLLLTFADGTCSRTAIAPHAILTATHCFGNGIVTLPALTVRKRIDDGNDHTLLIVAQTFTAHAQIAPMPPMGAQVSVTANPAELRHLYAQGTVAGDYRGDTLLNLPIFYGDSGAAVLDDRDRIVGVISGVRVLAGAGVYVEWGETKPFRFTAAQWREAGI